MSFSKAVNLEHAQRAVPCNICEDEVPGEYYCIECKQTLCAQCEKNHRKVAATRNHNIVLRTHLPDIDTATLTCADHGDQASCHCENCHIPVCIKCVTGKHKGHPMSDLADILEKEKRMLRDDIMVIKRSLSTLKKHKENILSEKENYNENIRKILKDMDDNIQELQRIHKKRVNEINSIQESHLSVFDGLLEEIHTQITLYEDRMSEYEEAIARNSLPVLRKAAKGKEPLPKIDRKLRFPEPPVFVPCKSVSIEENLGQLLISSSFNSKPYTLTTPSIISKFKSPLKGESSVCISKEGDVWLGGDKSRELVMVDIKGQVLRRRKIQNRPYSLAMMNCGDIIVSPRDSISVRRLLGDGSEDDVFDTKNGCAGVSITADQKLLICTHDGRVVKIQNDGINGKEVYLGRNANSAIHALETVHGNIFISDYINHAVVKVNKDGEVLSTEMIMKEFKKKGCPQGLVMDPIGNILCADNGNDCVYVEDQNQRFRELIGPSYGIKAPGWLAVDSDNNLWIAQDTGNIHVVKYLSQ